MACGVEVPKGSIIEGDHAIQKVEVVLANGVHLEIGTGVGGLWCTRGLRFNFFRRIRGIGVSEDESIDRLYRSWL